MDFRTACRLCKPGYYINACNTRWNEYGTQYGRNYKGELYWTAGSTVGGPLTEKDIQQIVKHEGSRPWDWQLFDMWGSTSPIRPEEQVDRVDPVIEQQEQHTVLRNDFIHQLYAMPIAYGQLGGEIAEKASRCTIESVLELLDKGHDDVRYRLVAKRKGEVHVVISGDLLKFFTEINT